MRRFRQENPERTAARFPLAPQLRNEYSFRVRMKPPPPGEQPRLQPPADKREAILDAALELFVQRGFYGAAVPEIALRAGVGAGTIYRYFDSKEALVNVLYQMHKNALSDRMLADFPFAAPAREQFHAFWSRLARYVEAEPKAFAFLEVHHHADYLDLKSRDCEFRMTQIGVSYVETAQARRDLRPGPPMLLIGIVLGAFIGVVRKSWECGMTLTPDVWAQAEQIVWEAIRS